MADGVSERPKLVAIAQLISEAAERGSELTRRLLAFARKQRLRPRETNINALILDTVKLLQSSHGVHIEIESQVAPDGSTRAVQNARDAMPGGGKLTLQSANVGLHALTARLSSAVANCQATRTTRSSVRGALSPACCCCKSLTAERIYPT